MRLQPVFERYHTDFASTDPSLEKTVDGRYFKLTDASMWNKLGLIKLACQVLFLVVRSKPDVVISTGAALGFFGIVFGKWLGKKTIWVDSLANVEQMSLAGRRVKPWADLWLTQWPHLDEENGPHYKGSVL